MGKDKQTCKLVITANSYKDRRVSIRPCGKDFFPEDAFGGSSKESKGNAINLKVQGTGKIVETDIPSGRWFFRDRKWVREFIEKHNLKAGDEVKINRIDSRTYEILAQKQKLTFIDLFAGIGGIRKGFEYAGARCVYSSEWNKYARQTYEANFGDMPEGDITQIDAKSIPDHDILVAGFPCQPFSLAGVSKKNFRQKYNF